MPDDIETTTATVDPVQGNQPDATTGVENATTTDPADAGNPPGNAGTPPAHSQPQSDPSNQAAQPPQQPPVEDWKAKFEQRDKSYTDLRAYANRVQAEHQKVQQLYQGLDPQQARDAITALQRQNELQQASPFSRRHPEYGQNRNRIERADLFTKAVEGMQDPEQVRAIANRMGITGDDLKFRNDAAQHRERMTEDLLSDPDAFIAERVQSVIQSQFAQYEQYQQAKTGSQNWLQSNAPLVQEFAGEMHQMMDSNVPSQQKALAYAQALAEIKALKAKVGESVEQVSTARAQQAVVANRAQGASRRTSPVSGGRYEDPAETLRKQGVSVNNPSYLQRLMALNESIAQQS